MSTIKHKRDQSEFIINNKRHFYYIIRDTIITLILWVLWLYLLYPLIAVLVWKFFGKNIYYYKSDVQIESLYHTLMQFFLYNGIIIPILGIVFVSWGVYNRKHFGKRNRRKREATPVTTQQLSQAYHVDESYIQSCQDARYLRIYHVDKSPQRGEHEFPPLNEKLTLPAGEAVSIYFNNNWGNIRQSSSFGTIKRERPVPLQRRKR